MTPIIYLQLTEILQSRLKGVLSQMRKEGRNFIKLAIKKTFYTKNSILLKTCILFLLTILILFPSNTKACCYTLYPAQGTRREERKSKPPFFFFKLINFK